MFRFFRLFGAMGFRALFVAIGLSFLLSLMLVAVPLVVQHVTALNRANERLAEIAAVQPLQEALAALRRHRLGLFLAGAGEPSRPDAAPPAWATLGLDEAAGAALAGLSPEDVAGRRRAAHFAAFAEAVDGVQARIAERVMRGGECARCAAWINDLPVIEEALARIELLMAVAARENGISDRLRPELSAAMAIAEFTVADVKRHLPVLDLDPSSEEALREDVEAVAQRVQDVRTLAYGLAISNTSYGVDEVSRIMAEAQTAVHALSERMRQLAGAGVAQQVSDLERNLLVTSLVVAFSLLFSCLGLWWAFRRLARNIDVLSQGAAQLATGDLSVDIRLDGRDELQQVAQSLLAVRDGLRGLVGEVINSAHAMTTGSLAFAQAASASVTRAQRQQEGTEHVVGAIEESAREVDQIVLAARETDQIAKSSDELATQGMAAVDQARQVLAGMRDDIVQATDCLDRMEIESASVSTVVGVIAEIAAQTSLLALNAAIEAARAGESGRGFAVVADEVRKLAERTSGSTREIGAMIERMQAITSQTVSAVRTAASHVETSNAQTRLAAERMSEVRDQARQVEKASERISHALYAHQQQTLRIESLVGGIAELSSENNKAMSAAVESARLLEGLAEDLRCAIGRFRVDGVADAGTPAAIELF